MAEFEIKDGRLHGKRGPIVVDELDLPILNLGSGDQALRPRENFRGPRGPVINVDLLRQTTLEQTGRPAQFPELTTQQRPTVHLQHDATDLTTLRKLSPTGTFREIHAVNPYGFAPHDAFPLLHPTGRMFVTGQEQNPYAQESKLLVKGNPRKEIPHIFLTPPPSEVVTTSTPFGVMHPDHAALNHSISGQRHTLDTTRSRTITLARGKKE